MKQLLIFFTINLFLPSFAISQDHPVNKLISQAVTASNNGDYKTACSKGKQALAIARNDKGGTPAVINMITDFNAGVCQNNSNSSNDDTCLKYNRAKQTCAPAADFPACMQRLGVGSSLTRSMCAPLLSADGW